MFKHRDVLSLLMNLDEDELAAMTLSITPHGDPFFYISSD